MSDRIRLNYDDGYPEGFSLLDNRDIWDSPGRRGRLLLRPAVLGVYVGMCSLPKGWEFHEAWLIHHMRIGRDALRRIVQELEAAGRLRREKVRDEKGRFIRTDWTLIRAGTPSTDFQAVDRPMTEKPSMAKSSGSLPATGFPAPAKPTDGEPVALVNTERAARTEKSSNTTTTANTLNWDALPQLSGEQQVVVVVQMKELPAEHRQDVLDELAGALRANAIKGQWPGWLHGVVQKALNGGFKPNHALAVQAERRKRLEARQLAEKRQAEAQARKNQSADPAAQARRKAHIAAIESILRP